MKKLLNKIGYYILSFIASTLNKFLVTLTLIASVTCTAMFLYGIWTLDYKLCFVCAIGVVCFVWSNKHT